jgi:hypothetical protein
VKILNPIWFATSAFIQTLVTCAILFSLLYPCSAAAQSGEVYTVKNVKVDVTAESAAVAREAALKIGQKEAHMRLMKRMVLIGDFSNLPKLLDQQLVQLVAGVEVVEEKISTVRYIAKFVVRFNPSAVRSYLRNAGIRFAETKSKAMIVLPLLRVQATLQLWDSGNLWLKAWRELPKSEGLIDLVVPKGETTDIADISPEQAVIGNDERIKSISQRYGAARALLTVATIKDLQGKKIIELATSWLSPRGSDRTSIKSLDNAKGQSLQRVLSTAANHLRDEIEEDWKKANLLRFEDSRELIAQTDLRGLSDLVLLKNKLETNSFVQKVEIVRVSLNSALIRVQYIGHPNQLSLSLSQRDIVLTRGSVYWKLQIFSQNE